MSTTEFLDVTGKTFFDRLRSRDTEAPEKDEPTADLPKGMTLDLGQPLTRLQFRRLGIRHLARLDADQVVELALILADTGEGVPQKALQRAARLVGRRADRDSLIVAFIEAGARAETVNPFYMNAVAELLRRTRQSVQIRDALLEVLPGREKAGQMLSDFQVFCLEHAAYHYVTVEDFAGFVALLDTSVLWAEQLRLEVRCCYHVHRGEVARARDLYADLERYDHMLGRDKDFDLVLVKQAENTDGAIKIFFSANNEMEFVPVFLEHYRALGRVHFIAIDNRSSDGTPEFLSAQPDVTLYSCVDSFADSNFNARWFNWLVPQLTTPDELCLKLDVDELLVWSDMDKVSLAQLLGYLNARKFDVMVAPMIDMFPETLRYEDGDTREAIREKAVYFDQTVTRSGLMNSPYLRFGGGVRVRIFGGANIHLTKTPIFRGGGEVSYLSANHRTTPARSANMVGALLHYKFTPSTVPRLVAQIKRGEHAKGGRRYWKFIRAVQGASGSFLGPKSRRFESYRDLAEGGVVTRSEDFRQYFDL